MAIHPSALVTGAGSGIGRATALLLAQAGYDLLLVGRTPGKLEETRQLINDSRSSGNSDRCLTMALDLCDPKACTQAIHRAQQEFGRLDALANVAGFAALGSIAQITPADWQKTIDTNVSYIMHLTAAAWPLFDRQRSGVIVNVSSLASIDPFPGFALYASAKAALNMFTRITASEGQAIGLKAVAVAPGAVETPMLRSLFSEQQIPCNHTLDPQTVATVIRDCITSRRSFTSGQVIEVPNE